MQGKEDLFLMTYDAKFLKNEPQVQIEDLKNRIRMGSHRDKDLLLKLLESRAEYKLTALKGPHVFYHGKMNGMSVYLFGEHHIKTKAEIDGRCIGSQTDKYFYSLLNELENGKTFYDVFFEEPYLKTDLVDLANRTSSSYILNMIHDTYKGCLIRTGRREENCKNFRFHYSDPRNVINHMVSELITEVGIVTDPHIPSAFRLLQRLDAVKILIDQFRGDTDRTIFQSFVFENPIVKKELGKSYLKNHIKRFIVNKIQTIIKDSNIATLRKIYDLLLGTHVVSDQELKMTYIEVTKMMLHLDALIMDTYLLSRMFKVYDNTRYPSYNGPNKSYNVIVYAGSAHIYTYKAFLESIGFVMNDVHGNPNTSSCITIANIARSRDIFNREPTPPSNFIDIPDQGYLYRGRFDYSPYIDARGHLIESVYEIPGRTGIRINYDRSIPILRSMINQARPVAQPAPAPAPVPVPALPPVFPPLPVGPPPVAQTQESKDEQDVANFLLSLQFSGPDPDTSDIAESLVDLYDLADIPFEEQVAMDLLALRNNRVAAMDLLALRNNRK